MKFRLKAYSIMEFGKRVDGGGNPHQEDCLFPAHNNSTDDDRLFILCDGMGGHDAGEVASATVCEAMSQFILSNAGPEGDFSAEIFERALKEAYHALDAKDNYFSERKMGTTMTLLKLHKGGCFIAHIGDSRVYHIRSGRRQSRIKILFRTDDHSLVNEMVKAGDLTPEEARQFPYRNIITRAMQPNMGISPKADVYETADIRPDDYFFLCSDGMLENMEDERLCWFFSKEAGDDERKMEQLINATQENSDNHSAIMVHILDVIH